MNNWSAEDAQARFCELLNACMNEGPQMVTQRGSEAAVLVSAQEWRRLNSAAGPGLKHMLLSHQARADWALPERSRAQRRPPQALR